MSTKILSILMTVTLGFVSVSSRAAPEPSSLKPPDPQEAESLSPEDVRELAYSQKRRIGLRRQGIDRCPKVAGWTSESLLDLALRKTKENKEEEEDEKTYFKKQNASPARQIEISMGDLRQLHKLGLDRYCIYTALPGTKDFLKPSGLVEAERDRMALSTTSAGGDLSDALGQKVWSDLADQFRGQASREASSPGTYTSNLPLKDKENGVRLTFIDSQPDGVWVLPRPSGQDSQHGFTLGYLAQSLVCPPSGPCAVTIAARRALRYRNFSSQEPLAPQEIPDGSGHIGLVSDLAAAILAEVLEWRDIGTSKHLILNLSLGWDGELFGDLDAPTVSRLEPSVQAVYRALRFARQSGVLVVAAAGNSRGGERSAWPLLPAAWELRRPAFFPFRFGRKPVYAIGGVDWQGLPLPNTRKGGLPRRVTYADHSVTGIEPNTPTVMYTGTSVSAAVASSIAAVVWHLRPELEPAEVMRLITRSGGKLDVQADFYAWKILPSKLVSAPDARRLSLCQAVRQACGTDGKRCPARGQLSECPSVPEPRLGELLVNLQGGNHSAGDPVFPDPLRNLADVTSQRWVIPQPELTPCPGCTLVPIPPPSAMAPGPLPYDLVLEISTEWQKAAADEGVTIEGATLSIARFAKGQPATKTIYELQKDYLSYGSIHRVSGLVQGPSLRGCTALLTFKVKKGTEIRSIQNPVIVDPGPLSPR